ncbi:DUF721 domain-containing protein [Trichlorobacter lovleyi]|uniref:DUF721 domain-containing protein n=1 Tax=Trichlorobacter lovleyi (strain ATCC BAA-1151 / DSM 17278 / SZ) TaxID=398767 RepID=B3E5R8_TRIL1|nr:DUF721 domain-containing protein [Trichlorobacter lovleyi]ACD96159.1 conserved hypothetical protein [Trichlorobacter lovleyi SZ]
MAGKRPKGSPEPIGRLLGGRGINPELAARLKDLVVWQSWDRAVGEAIARRARPLRLVGGVLTVVVSSGPWMQQLSFMKAELRDRVNSLLGEERVREIVLKAGRISRDPEEDKEVRPAPKPLSPQQLEQIRLQVSSVDDVELRQALQGLMEHHYSNR